MASQTASTIGVSESLLSESLNAPLLEEDKDSQQRGETGHVKLRSLSGPMYSTNPSASNRFHRPFSGGNVDSPRDEPFTIVGAIDESGTMVKAKTGFMRSTNVPGEKSVHRYSTQSSAMGLMNWY